MFCQLINHRHVLVNGHIIDILRLINQIIDNKWVGLKINELLVVEYYFHQLKSN